MRNFEELDYYQILDIPVDASPFEISRAYKNALEVYGESSLLTYSLFSEVERINILSRIRQAHDTLIDRAKRKEYDASQGMW